MATTHYRIPTFTRPLLLGIWCTLLATGCDTPEPKSPSKPDPSSATQESIAEPKTTKRTATSSKPKPTTNQTNTDPKPLDLSRGTNLESLDEATDIGGTEPGNLLPDLFEDQPSKTGARASGRVLMSETEESSMQAIEGVEFKLEVPVN